MSKKVFLIAALLIGVFVNAQHHHDHPKDTVKPKKANKTQPAKTQHKDQQHNHDSMMAPMTHAYSRNLPMTRNGSGTSWLPDSTPMYAYSMMTDKWMFMFHGNIFLRYNSQDIFKAGNRGGTKVDAPNMFMFMGQRNVGERGLFHFNSMFSFDPFTVGAEGYPLLYQSGETYQNQPLIDRQHPHDLISELSIGYTHAFSEDIDLTGYFAFPGEPAIGPSAFMHRISAMNNPDAPLSHHWQDATHITFGVGTLGLRLKKVKLEGSIFTGREPDENRYDFDSPRFDSYAMRVMYNPNANLSFQISQAQINSPEWLNPEEDVARTTASVTHQLPLTGMHRYLASTIVWGYNHGHAKEHSVLLESNLQLDRTAIYGRYEWVQKSSGELNIIAEEHDQLFNIQALTLGTNYTIMRKFQTNAAIGAQFTVFAAPELNQYYGQNPVSAEVYLRVYPHLMKM